MERANVPCNGCTACCQRDLLILHPEMGDDPSQYETMEVVNPITNEAALALQHGDDGSCIYLGENGCTIHSRAPAICREFDCRAFYLTLLRDTTRGERKRLVKSGMIGVGVLDAAKKRLREAA